MAWVTTGFIDTWRSKRHVGPAKPTVVVQVRRGNWRRAYRDWPGDFIAAEIPGEPTDDGYWFPIFTETTPWVDVPNIASVELTQELEGSRGMSTATVVMENVGYGERTGPGGLYHVIERGFYAPTRGFTPSTRGDAGVAANDWSAVLTEMADIRIWQGFGAPERTEGEMPTDGGSNGTWVFHGLIDDVDLDATPAQLTFTARMGKTLTDERVFGWVKSRQLKDPVTFMDPLEAELLEAALDSDLRRGLLAGEQVILLQDVSDMVRIALRWGGFQEWEVEDAGVAIKGRFVVNRASYLIDIIQAACEQTGFEFFIADPSDGDSMGVPIFRRPAATIRQPEAIAVELRDTDLLADIRGKFSESPLGYIIRVRGKESTVGRLLGGDPVRRLMAVYRPPWTADNTMGGIIKHVTHTDAKLRTDEACLAGCYLIAIAEAVEAATAVVELPGLPLVELDDQVGVTDTATGLNSRLWVTSRTTTMTTGRDASWHTTLTGSLIDSPHLAALIDEIIARTELLETLAEAWGDVPPPAVTEATRYRRIRA